MAGATLTIFVGVAPITFPDWFGLIAVTVVALVVYLIMPRVVRTDGTSKFYGRSAIDGPRNLK